ncbi:helix-turn-helix domain-containing protein [Jiella mangrovi]|uniref:Helix-turn-helix transcriptional regulator n=1 Tax=Jiella mangrovi TaxID=2821407 RepID=A0ABS4BLA3_9HYPH|nr:helix-turn-helix transcriptional regulator [Jiella mangrovi]MBP0617503.1 helix-turn-helix transcriptional regulator [Jiella mangrovi]
MPAFTGNKVDVAVGNRVRELRISAGLTQADIALYLSSTVSEIDRFERGMTRIGIGRLGDLAIRFGVSVMTFFELVGYPAEDGVNNSGTPGQAERVRILVRSILMRAAQRVHD